MQTTNRPKWLNLITAIACLLTAQLCLAQATLRGVLLKDGDDGQPFQHIPVKVNGSSGSDISTSDGIFSLRFSEKRPGDEVNLVIDYPAGWKVLFSVMLIHALPKPGEPKPRQSPTKIIACQVAQCELLRSEFLRLKNLKIVDKRFAQQLAALESKAGVQQHEIANLKAGLAKERDRAADLAKQFARLAEGEVSLLYRQAWDLYLEGELDEALKVISEARLEQEEDAINMTNRTLANAWLLRAEITNLNNNFDEAGREYDKAVVLAPKSWDVWFAYANFHYKLNHFKEARNGFEQSMALAQQPKDMARVAQGEYRSQETRKTLEEALATHRPLATNNPQAFLPLVAKTTVALGVLDYLENKPTQARQLLQKALTIFQDLATRNPAQFSQEIELITVLLAKLPSVPSQSLNSPNPARVH